MGKLDYDDDLEPYEGLTEYVLCEIDKEGLARGALRDRVFLIGRPDQILVDLDPSLTGCTHFVFIDVPVLARLLFPDPKGDQPSSLG